MPRVLEPIADPPAAVPGAELRDSSATRHSLVGVGVPLGMYSACTSGLFHVNHADAPPVLALTPFWSALAARAWWI